MTLPVSVEKSMKEAEEAFLKEQAMLEEENKKATPVISEEEEEEIIDETEPEIEKEKTVETQEQSPEWKTTYDNLQQKIDFLQSKLSLFENLFSKEAQPQPAPQQTQQISSVPEIDNLKNEFPEIYSGIEKLLQKYVPREEMAAQTAETQAQLFYSRLTQEVPDWEKINIDPEFIKWLKNKEKFVNATRHELLLNAYNQGDVATASEFFKAYKQIKSSEQNLEGEPNKGSQNVAPPIGRAKNIASNMNSKPIFRKAEIEQFYRDAALGKFTQEFKLKKEKEIFEAMKDNRIIG